MSIDLTKIVTGMKNGPEAIDRNFQEVQKISDTTDQLASSSVNNLTANGMIGAQNPNLNNLKQGFYTFGFWDQNTDDSWPKNKRGKRSEWGTIVQIGDANGTCSQMLVNVPADAMYIRTHAGGGWSEWRKLTAQEL